MASGQDIGFLEKSSNASLNEPTSNPGCSTGPTVTLGQGVRTSSSPAILELSKDESRYQGNDSPRLPLRNPLTRSCPQNFSEETPLTSSTGSSEHEENDENNHEEQQAVQRCSTYCNSCIDWYLDTMVEIRKSKFIHIFQALFLMLPISAVVMGLVYADKCPESRHLPVFGAIIGLVGILFIVLWIAMNFCQQRGTPCYDQQKFIVGFVFLTTLVLVGIDMHLVAVMTPSFDESDKDYCNVTFYRYVVLKQILTGVAFLISASIYFPRCRHDLCCCNCAPLTPPVDAVIYEAI